MRRLKLIGLRAGWGPLSAEMRVTKSERDLLHPLFVILRDKRALLYSAQCRSDSDDVTPSIEAIRRDLTFALQALGPDAIAAGELERLRRTCREYLDAVAGSRDNHPVDDSTSALDRLRASFREVAGAIASDYDLPSAGELVEEMGPRAAPHSALAPSPKANLLIAAPVRDRRDNGPLWSTEQLAEFERVLDIRTIWIFGRDFRTDMPGMPFHDTIRHNIVRREVTYAYVTPDQPTSRHQLTTLRQTLGLDDDARMFIMFLENERWIRMPYTAGNVTIYNPFAVDPVGFFWYPGGNGESFGRLGDYVVLQWVTAILKVCPELGRSLC